MSVSLQDLESAVVQKHTHNGPQNTMSKCVQKFMWVKMYTVIVILCACVSEKGAGPAARVCLSLVCVTRDTDRRLRLVDARVPRS